MTRLIGALLVVSATSLWGVEAALKLKDEYLQMQYMERILGSMKSRISYTRTDLEDVFRQISAEVKEPYKGWLLEIAREMEKNEGKMIAQIWHEQTKERLHTSGLSKNVIDRVAQMGDCMGSADLELQIKNLELYMDELEQRMDEMRPEIREKVRVYHWLGVTGGVFISVLLL